MNINDFEIKIVKHFQAIGRGKIDFFTTIISSVPVLAIFWIMLVVWLAWLFPQQRELFIAQVLGVAILHFSISEGFFKYVLPRYIETRKRPYVSYPEIIQPIGHRFSDGSIPSSHMTSTVAMLFIISANFPTFFIPLALLALLMSFARIHNGMHYPSDIILGIILGGIYAIISINIF